MLNKIKAKSFYNKIKRISKSYSNKKTGVFIIIFKIFISIAIAIAMFFIAQTLMPWLQKQIPNDSNWAVATIAIPVAFFAVFISVHIVYLKKMLIHFTQGTNLHDIYNINNHPSDLRRSEAIFLGVLFIIWFWGFLWGKPEEKYAGMIACTAYMTIVLIYLILYDLYIIGRNQESMFVSYFIYDFRSDDVFFKKQHDTLQTAINNMNTNIFCEQFEEIYDGSSMYCLKSIIMAISANTATIIQKNAFVQLFYHSNKLKDNLSNLLLYNYLFCISKELLIVSYNNKDYEFFILLSRAIIFSAYKRLEKSFKPNKQFNSIFIDTDQYKKDLTDEQYKDLIFMQIYLLNNYYDNMISIINNIMSIQETFEILHNKKTNENSLSDNLLIDNYIERIIANNKMLYEKLRKQKDTFLANKHIVEKMAKIKDK